MKQILAFLLLVLLAGPAVAQEPLAAAVEEAAARAAAGAVAGPDRFEILSCSFGGATSRQDDRYELELLELTGRAARPGLPYGAG